MRIGSGSLDVVVAAIALGSPASAAAAESADHPSAAPLAWIRFDDAHQDYLGTPYLFLGDGPIALTFQVRPAAGHAIELSWGSKNDEREAVLTVNGREVVLRRGGYQGFRWLRAPVPEGVAGDRYDVALRAGAGRAAFLAEIRLVGEEKGEGRGADPKARSFRTALRHAPPSGPAPRVPVEAFPEMREMWDREPAAPADPSAIDDALFRQAERNARLAAEGLYRCRRFVDGWLANADPATGLIPRNLGEGRDYWNGRDAGADNYPFMVLTAAMTDRPLFEGRMLEILRTETRLTCRIDRLPDDYSFSKKGWRREKADLQAMIFEGAEYVKDGLLPLTEWLGASPWSERMIGIIDDIWKNATIDTPFGKIPTLDFEVNGDLLQACARIHWFTGDRKYLDWAIRLGDYYLLGSHHPTRDMDALRLSDHGCEAVNGLSELYMAVSRAAPAKREAYREPIHAIFDRILEVGRNEDGMLYSTFNPQTGAHSASICDTWGYDYDGFYVLYLVDGTEPYRDAVRKALSHLGDKYAGAPWGDRSADGYADSIEGALNLYNREPIPQAAAWIDSQIRMMWSFQKREGIIEGWHGDGNSARTTLMYVLWKSQGIRAEPWRADVRVGAVRDGGAVLISAAADRPWKGRLLFDVPRHETKLHLPIDYPRINRFPEWFTVRAGERYVVRDMGSGTEATASGERMAKGLPVELEAGSMLRWRVEAAGRTGG
ncbi:MAG: hypothetical protein JXP34_19350 [Planctomycetes bacterium]|nr:hypothetical protein [Planctomycetota bacterium]